MERGLFRYDVTACETKVSFSFLCFIIFCGLNVCGTIFVVCHADILFWIIVIGDSW